MSDTTNYIGTKMYLTERGRGLYDGYSYVPLTSEWEVAEIEDKAIVTLYNKEYGYTTEATYASLFMYSEQRDFTFEKPEQPLIAPHSLIGKKVRLTDKSISNLEIKPSMKGKIGKIQHVDDAGYCTLLFSDYDFSVVLLDYLSETPDFEIIEEPGMPTPINREGMFQTLPTPNFSISSTVLDKAKDLIYGDREKDYGKTSDNFADICTGWEIIFKNGFTPERVGLAMAWLKICRASTDNCEKEDSLIDLAGYAGCVEKIKKNL